MANSNKANSPVEDNPSSSQPRSAAGGSRHSLSLVVSGIAVLLAALALIANQMGQPAPRVDPFEAVNSKLGQIEARIGDMESQLTNDKLDGVNMQLKRIILELEQLSRIADEGTRARIDQARGLLIPLSEPATKVKAEVDVQSTLAPENQSAPGEGLVVPEEAEVKTPMAEPDAAESGSTEPASDANGAGDLAPTEGPDAGDSQPPQTPEQPQAMPTAPAEPVTHL